MSHGRIKDWLETGQFGTSGALIPVGYPTGGIGALIGYTAGTPSATANTWAPGAINIDYSNAIPYYNSGTYASPTWTSILAAATGNSLDSAYDQGGAGVGRTITVDQGAVTLAGSHATNDVLSVTGATGSGSLIDLAQSGTGKDIDGTGSLWHVTKAGVGTFASLVATSGLSGGASCDITLNTNKFTVDATNGNVVTAGSVTWSATTGNVIVVNTNKFLVAADTGNTTIAGDLGVTGTATIGTLAINAIQSAAALTINAATGANTITIGNLSTGGIIISDNVTMGQPFLFSTTNELRFHDADLKIYASADGQLDIDADTEIEMTTATLDVNVTAFDIDASSASAITVDSANLTVETTTSGVLDLNAAGNFTLDAGGTVSVDGVGNSNFTIASGNLTVQTTTTGNIVINAVQALDVDAGGNSNISVTSANLTLETLTSGTLAIQSAGVLDVDASGASSIVNDTGNFTIQTTTSGAIILNSIGSITPTSAGAVTWTHSGGAWALNSTSQNITLATLTSGDVILDPVDDARVADACGLIIGSATVGPYTAEAATEVQVIGTTSADAGVMIAAFVGASAANPGQLVFLKSRSADVGATPAIHVNNDELGEIVWHVDDGNDFASRAAQIHAEVDDASVAQDQTGGALVFSVTADGAATVTEAMRIANTGDVQIADGRGMSIGYAGQETVGAGSAVSELQVHGTAIHDASVTIGMWSTTNTDQPILYFLKSGSGTIGSHVTVADNESLGAIIWTADDATDLLNESARIHAEIDDSSVTSDQTGGALVFSTTNDGANTVTEQWRITQAGILENTSGAGIDVKGGSILDTTANASMIIQSDLTNANAGTAITINTHNAVDADTARVTLGGGANTATWKFSATNLCMGTNTIYGGDAANEDLALAGTSHGTVTTSYITASEMCDFSTAGVATLVVANTVDDTDFLQTAVNGLMGIDSSNGRFYFRYGGAWHYCSQDAGFQIRADENICPKCGKPMTVDQRVVGRIDKIMSDGAPHGLYEHLDCKEAAKAVA